MSKLKTKSECLALLNQWSAQRASLDAEYDKLKSLFDASSQCSLVAVMYTTFFKYTETLAKLIDDEDDWLN